MNQRFWWRNVQIVFASGTGSANPSPRKRMNESRSETRPARPTGCGWPAGSAPGTSAHARKEDDRRGSGRPAAQPFPDPAGKAQTPPNHSAARACRPWPKAPSDAPRYRRTRPDPASHAPVRDQLHRIMIPRSAPGGFWRCPAVVKRRKAGEGAAGGRRQFAQPLLAAGGLRRQQEAQAHTLLVVLRRLRRQRLPDRHHDEVRRLTGLEPAPAGLAVREVDRRLEGLGDVDGILLAGHLVAIHAEETTGARVVFQDRQVITARVQVETETHSRSPLPSRTIAAS